jgi:carbamate kinase
VVSLLSRVEVDPQDPAFLKPTKPIGPVYATKSQADQIAAARRWVMAPDGIGWRRVVPSPRPLRLTGLDAIRWLLERGALVIAAGGGGIPVVPRRDGAGLQGVEAVIDKDLCSALIATRLEADCLIIATDVDAVCVDWGLPTQRALGATSPQALAKHDFASGSMAPKVQAACEFVRATGRRAAIGALDQIEALLAGDAGTQVRPDAA